MNFIKEKRFKMAQRRQKFIKSLSEEIWEEIM